MQTTYVQAPQQATQWTDTTGKQHLCSHLTHASQQTNGISESLQTPQHQKRLLLQLPLVVLSGRQDQTRSCRSRVVHDQRLQLHEANTKICMKPNPPITGQWDGTGKEDADGRW